jgi:hypothetical protein
LGSLAYPGEDVWWDLDYRVKETAASVADAMTRYGVDFLDRYGNYRCVLAELERSGELPFSNAGRSALIGALICYRLGRADEARGWFDRASGHAARLPHPGFLAHVAALKVKCGL